MLTDLSDEAGRERMKLVHPSTKALIEMLVREGVPHEIILLDACESLLPGDDAAEAMVHGIQHVAMQAERDARNEHLSVSPN